LQLTTMQVYELLANYDLYLQTEQGMGKHPFRFLLSVDADNRSVAFELEAMPIAERGVVARDKVDALMGLHRYQLINAANDLYLPFEYWQSFADLGLKLYAMAQQRDAIHITVHASFETPRSVIIHHAQVSVDERAAFRHAGQTTPEIILHPAALEGSVVCIGSGAGLVMMAADALHQLLVAPHLRVNALCEIEEGVLLRRLPEALEIGRRMPATRQIMVIIHSTFVDCDAIAEVLIQFRREKPLTTLIAHLEGLNAEAACARLQQHQIATARGFTDLAHRVLALSESDVAL